MNKQLKRDMKINSYNQFNSAHKLGDVLTGTVTMITRYGAFISIGGTVGLVHNSEISHSRSPKAEEVVELGQVVEVMLVGTDDDRCRLSFSIKQLQPHPFDIFAERHLGGDLLSGVVSNVVGYGAFIEVSKDVVGLLHGEQYTTLTKGQSIDVLALSIDKDLKRISLTSCDSC